MVPQFALDLSMEGIALLARNLDGTWTRRGAVRLDDSDFGGGIARLRDRCIEAGGAEFTTWLIIPDSQLLFTTFERDDRRPEVTIRQNLVGRTPYDVDELVFDYIERGDRLEVVVVARETLQEAEGFAVEHGFRPVALTANPSDGQFRMAPWFGQTALAAEVLAGRAVMRLETPFELSGSGEPLVTPAPEVVAGAGDSPEVAAESDAPDQDRVGGGNPEDVAHVADLLAQARPGQEGAPSTGAVAAEAEPAGSEALSAPSFSSRRRGKVEPHGDDTVGLERVTPRLTGVTRAPARPAGSAPLSDVRADRSGEETAIAKAARLAHAELDVPTPETGEAAPVGDVPGPEAIEVDAPEADTTETELVAEDTPTAEGAGHSDPSPRPADTLRAERGPVAAHPAPAAPGAEIGEDDEFLLDPLLAARSSSGPRPAGLYLAAGIAALALALGGWFAVSSFGPGTPDVVEAASDDPVGRAGTEELAALLPGAQSTAPETTAEIAAPAPVQVSAAREEETEDGGAPLADTVSALLDSPLQASLPDVSDEVSETVAPTAETAPITGAGPALAEQVTPGADTPIVDGPATPGTVVAGETDVPLEETVAELSETGAPEQVADASTEAVSAAFTEAASAAADTQTETAAAIDAADAPVLSLLSNEDAAQAAALEALLAAPLGEAERLAPSAPEETAPEAQQVASAATSTDTGAETLETVAASSTASVLAQDAARDLPEPTAEGIVTAGGFRLIAGRPDILPEPRPGVENVVSVAATTSTDTPEIDAEEEARRAVLARVRPVIRPRIIEDATPEDTDETVTADATEPDAETAEENQALAALRATRPSPRPANLSVPEEAPEPEAEAPAEEDPAVIAAEQAATASLAAARAAAEAANAAEQEAASISRLALAQSERPDTRPRAVERAAARIVERRREAAATPVSAPSQPQSNTARTPTIRSAGGNASRAATRPNQLRLNRIALIGTYGGASSKRALVRMGNGRYVKVEVGDRLDRGRVIAIGDGVVRYQRGGRNLELKLPPI